MGIYRNARMVVDLASVCALHMDQDGPNNITSLTPLMRRDAEKALEFAVTHKLIEQDNKLTDLYKTTIKGDEFLSRKFGIPFGIFDLWATNRKVSLTALLTAAGILVAIAGIVATRIRP